MGNESEPHEKPVTGGTFPRRGDVAPVSQGRARSSITPHKSVRDRRTLPHVFRRRVAIPGEFLLRSNSVARYEIPHREPNRICLQCPSLQMNNSPLDRRRRRLRPVLHAQLA